MQTIVFFFMQRKKNKQSSDVRIIGPFHLLVKNNATKSRAI